MKLSIKTTTDCTSPRCRNCSAIPFMDANPNWQTSLEDIENLTKYTKQAGYLFSHILLSGGEPLLWNNIVEGTRLLRGIGKNLILVTNALAIFNDSEKVFGIISDVDEFRISKYSRNEETINRFLEVIRDEPFRHKVTVDDTTTHLIPPREPVPNSTPAECLCDAYSVFKGCVEICGPARNVIHNLGWNPEDFPKLSVPISENYLDFFKDEDRFDMEWCKYCIANQKVAVRAERVKN